MKHQGPPIDITNEATFNPKYDDTYIHKWANFGVEWLDETLSIPKEEDFDSEEDFFRACRVYIKSQPKEIEGKELFEWVKISEDNLPNHNQRVILKDRNGLISEYTYFEDRKKSFLVFVEKWLKPLPTDNSKLNNEDIGLPVKEE